MTTESLPRALFLLLVRYCAPEQYIMSKQTPKAPSPPVAAALSPVLWQLNLPDRFDMYSVGLIFLQFVSVGGKHVMC